MLQTKFYIGTAGWKYDDWIGSFYPRKESGGFDWLSYYAHYFNCIEVNSTFYAYMNPWIRKTQDAEDFSFVLKLHQDFTHKRTYTKKNIEDMLSLLSAIHKANRLGGLLVQFPQSFRFDGNSAAYISSLKELFGQYNLYMEVRHGSFQTADAYEFFRQARINCITIDQPVIGNAVNFKSFRTGDSLYVRLHGRNKKEWFAGFGKQDTPQTDSDRSKRYEYLYSPGELTEMVQQIKDVIITVEKIYIITNNHPKGNAVANAFLLMSMLIEREVLIPETTLTSYPQLITICQS
jgi:uncharacterized protein YecE (DUF72 family)